MTMVSMSAGRRRCFCRNLHSQHAVTLRILGFEMYRNSASYPAFGAEIWPKSAGLNAGRTARDWLSRFQRSHRRLAAKGPLAVAPRSLFASELQ